MYYAELNLSSSFWSKRVSAPPETINRKVCVRLKSKDKSISLQAGMRLEITACPQEKVLQRVCRRRKYRKSLEFRVAHPVSSYVGGSPVLVVTKPEAEHESRPGMGDLFNFTAVITPESDVQSAEHGVLEVMGYCDPKHHIGMVWLNAT